MAHDNENQNSRKINCQPENMNSKCSCVECDSLGCFASGHLNERCSCPKCKNKDTCLSYEKDIHQKDSRPYLSTTQSMRDDSMKEKVKREEVYEYDKNTNKKTIKKTQSKYFYPNTVSKDNPMGINDRTYEKPMAHVHSVAITYSRKELNPSTAKLSAQIMNIPYREINESISHGTSSTVPPTSAKITKYDIFKRIKEAYEACSCKVCECIVGKSLPIKNELCDCKPCECEECKSFLIKMQLSNGRGKQVPGPECPCIRCNNKNCKGVAKNAKMPMICDCKPSDYVQYIGNYTKPCSCTPCQCIECRSMAIHKKKPLIMTSAEDYPQTSVCQCNPCDCSEFRAQNAQSTYEMSSSAMHVISTGINRPPSCCCETCISETCNRGSVISCDCEIHNRVMRKPIEKNSHNYDVRRTIVINNPLKKPENRNRDTIAMYAALPNVYPTFCANKNKCSCCDCNCLLCDLKEDAITAIKSSQMFDPVNIRDHHSNRNECSCLSCECKIYNKQHNSITQTRSVQPGFPSKYDVYNCLQYTGRTQPPCTRKIHPDVRPLRKLGSKMFCKCSPCGCMRCTNLKKKCTGDVCECSQCKCKHCINNEHNSSDIIFPIKRAEVLTPFIFRAKAEASNMNQFVLSTNKEYTRCTKSPVESYNLELSRKYNRYQKDLPIYKKYPHRNPLKNVNKEVYDILICNSSVLPKTEKSTKALSSIQKNEEGHENNIKYDKQINSSNYDNRSRRTEDNILGKRLSDYTPINSRSKTSYMNEDVGNSPILGKRNNSYESCLDSFGDDYSNLLEKFPQISNKNNCQRSFIIPPIVRSNINFNNGNTFHGSRTKNKISNLYQKLNNSEKHLIHDNSSQYKSTGDFLSYGFNRQSFTDHNAYTVTSKYCETCIEENGYIIRKNMAIQTLFPDNDLINDTIHNKVNNNQTQLQFILGNNNVTNMVLNTNLSAWKYPERYTPINNDNNVYYNIDYENVQNTLKEAREFSLELMKILQKYEKANNEFESTSDKLMHAQGTILNFSVSYTQNRGLYSTINQTEQICLNNQENMTTTKSNVSLSGDNKLDIELKINEQEIERTNILFNSNEICDVLQTNSIKNIERDSYIKAGISITNKGLIQGTRKKCNKKIEDSVNTLEISSYINIKHKQVSNKVDEIKNNEIKSDNITITTIKPNFSNPIQKLSFKTKELLKNEIDNDKKTKNNIYIESDAVESYLTTAEGDKSCKLPNYSSTKEFINNGNYESECINKNDLLKVVNKLDPIFDNTDKISSTSSEYIEKFRKIRHSEGLVISIEDFKKIKEDKAWPIVKKNFCLQPRISYKKMYKFPSLKIKHKEAEPSVVLNKSTQPTKFARELRQRDRDLLTIRPLPPMIKTSRNNTEKKVTSSANYSNDKMNGPRSSCDSLKVCCLNLRRVSDHTVLIKWNAPRTYIDVLGYEDNINQYFCINCASYIMKFESFKAKCNRAQQILSSMKLKNAMINIEAIQSIDRKEHQLESNLTVSPVIIYDNLTPILIDHMELCEIISNVENIDNVCDDDYEDIDKNDTEEYTELKDIDHVNKEVIDHNYSLTYSNNFDNLKEVQHKTDINIENKIDFHCKNIKDIKSCDIDNKYLSDNEALLNFEEYENEERKFNDSDKYPKNFNAGLFENYTTVVFLSKEDAKKEMLLRRETSNYVNSAFKCELCYRGFGVKDAFDNHMKRHTEEYGKYKCPFCHVHFSEKRYLCKHHLACHKRKFYCKICPYVCFCTHQAKIHVNLHKGKKYPCTQCAEVFSMPNSLLMHKRMKHVTECVCELCGCTFATPKGLHLHKKRLHIQEKNEKKGPACEDCGIHFTSETAWKKHLVLSSKHCLSHGCKYCGETFSNDGDLKTHIRTHAATRFTKKLCVKDSFEFPGSCLLCEKWLSDRKEFKSHMMAEHPLSGVAQKLEAEALTPFVCEVCGQMFKQRCFLTYHQRKHTGERPYKCVDCGKSFQLAGALSTHKMVHTKKGRHKCEICGRTFTHKSGFNKHMKMHLGIRPHKCDICEKSFISPCDVRMHIKYVHNKVPWPKKDKSKRNKD